MHDMITTQTDYQTFLERKRHTSNDAGFAATYFPEMAFDFQRAIIERSVQKGRCAVFADTGLGKTLIEIAIADNIVRHTNKRVLIMTPLAVAFQFIIEAEKIGVSDIEYSRDGKFTKKIVICNYERLHYFDPNDFDAVICDESSILKNFEGATRNQITAFVKKVRYRFLATATPSPNDYIELGTSSEALGHLGYIDMLGRFFKNNQNNVVKIGQVDKARLGAEFYLKPHAERSFWQWVASWSISIRKPSDLGFSDAGYDLPTLHERPHVVENQIPLVVNGQPRMFNEPALTFAELKAETRATLTERCEKAAALALEHDTSVYWVNLNDEGKMMRQLDPTAVEIHGQMDIDKKEELLIAFSKGEIKKLITKTSITAFGLNWQHCNHTTYFPTYSYEQYYQAIRRFWRFGQTREVTVDLVLSDGQTRVMESLRAKKDKADSMFTLLAQQANSTFSIPQRTFTKPVITPMFLKP